MRHLKERSLLPRIITPLWGMKDPVLSPSVLRCWQEVYPHATTHELEDASHFLQEDAPERMVQWIRKFLEANT